MVVPFATIAVGPGILRENDRTRAVEEVEEKEHGDMRSLQEAIEESCQCCCAANGWYDTKMATDLNVVEECALSATTTVEQVRDVDSFIPGEYHTRYHYDNFKQVGRLPHKHFLFHEQLET